MINNPFEDFETELHKLDQLGEYLSEGGYITLFKPMLKILGKDEAILFSELTSMYRHCLEKNMCTEVGEFYYSIPAMQTETTLSVYQQTKAIEKLRALSLVSVETKASNFSSSDREMRHFKIETRVEVIKQILNSVKEIKK